MKVKLALSVVPTALLMACAAPSQTSNEVRITAPFDAFHAKRLTQPGVGSVKGSAFLRQNGGGLVTCAGNPVYLTPATAYAAERMGVLYGPGSEGYAPAGRDVMFIPDDPAYHQLALQTRCDVQGVFVFDRIADGDYFISTHVVWRVGSRLQGGHLMKRITVAGPAMIQVTLAR